MRVMLTRPREDSERLAESLRARGDEVVIEPMLRIVASGAPPALDGVSALIATSANGIRAFAQMSPHRDLTVYAVGDATARAARQAGFAAVESAAGDSTALAAHIANRATPDAGVLLHVRGRAVAGDLEGLLTSKGFSVRAAVLYEAEAADALSAEARDLIAEGKIDAVLFFSPRTAGTFVRLVREAGLADRCRAMTAICLSATVAEAGSALTWNGVKITETPDGAAILRLCDQVRESRKT